MGQRWLLVEGADDSNFFYHFFGAQSWPVAQLGEADNSGCEDVRIVPCDGDVKRVCALLRAGVENLNVESVGVVVDWDDPDTIATQKNRWQTIARTLVAAGYVAPEAPLPAGTVLTHPSNGPRPRVGAWLMPANVGPGMLEDFAAALIQADDQLWPIALSTVAALPEMRFGEPHVAKASLHTWLAWQKIPGQPIGQALRACRYLDLGSAPALALRDWLSTVFDLSPPA